VFCASQILTKIVTTYEPFYTAKKQIALHNYATSKENQQYYYYY